MEKVAEVVVVAGNSPAPFLMKTYDMVDDPSTDAVVSWSTTNNSFVVLNVPEFSRHVLPKFFKHNNFSSFVRQLNTYGFRKVDPDRFEFANEGFLRGQKHLLKTIMRRKATHGQSHPQPSQAPSSSVRSCVEVGKFGLEEDVVMLKRDKNVLMQELVRLRQQQQATDNQLHTVGERVHEMEQRQQQMMSFLAKAMQSPGFVAQLVHQPNDSNRRISGVNKKRRLHNPGEENIVRNQNIHSSNGQVVKYQPLMNEAAKVVLLQILKINASGRLEKKINNTNGFLLDKMHLPNNALDTSNTSSWVSGVTLSEVLPSSLQPCLSMESELLCNPSSDVISNIQYSPRELSREAAVAQIPQICAPSSHDKTASCVFPRAEAPKNNIYLPDMILEASKNSDIECNYAIPASVGGNLSILSTEVPSNPDFDAMLDDTPKLPGINDVFWEQFLAASPLNGDTDEITSSILDANVVKEQDLTSEQENEWDKMRHMNHLTEQMGLLAAAPKEV